MESKLTILLLTSFQLNLLIKHLIIIGHDYLVIFIFQPVIRSAHGFSDTDMSTLLDQLQRESDDLCGHRGLTPGILSDT